MANMVCKTWKVEKIETKKKVLVNILMKAVLDEGCPTAFINRSSNIKPDNITPNKLFYPFIKDVYLTRQTKMVEWMENIEKAISKIMADKVYTSAEFKRERDNFHVRFSLSLALFISVTL